MNYGKKIFYILIFFSINTIVYADPIEESLKTIHLKPILKNFIDEKKLNMSAPDYEIIAAGTVNNPTQIIIEQNIKSVDFQSDLEKKMGNTISNYAADTIFFDLR